MGNTFEFKLQTPSATTVDNKTIDFAKSFSEFKASAAEQLTKLKERVKTSKTVDQIKNYSSNFPLYADPGSLTLTIGKESIKAKDEAEYQQYQKEMQTQIDVLNQEMTLYFQNAEQQKQDVTEQTKQDTDVLKKNVKQKTRVETITKNADGSETKVITEQYEDEKNNTNTAKPEKKNETQKKETKAEKINVMWPEDKHFANFDTMEHIIDAYAHNLSYRNAVSADAQGQWDDTDILYYLANTDLAGSRVRKVDRFYHVDTRNPIFITAGNPDGTLCIPKKAVKNALKEYDVPQ